MIDRDLCEMCGSDVRTGFRFCSKECFLASRRVTKVCAHCGESFTVLKRYDSRQFCSRRCCLECHRAESMRDDSAWVKTACANCGIEIKVYRKRYETARHSFCDQNCYLQWHRAVFEIRKCESCERQCCSDDCFQLRRSEIDSERSHKGVYWSHKAGEVSFDSFWERRRMKELDWDAGVLSWKRCDDVIPWIDQEGRKRVYSPDFRIEYVSGTVVEEIKGWMTDDDTRKINAAKLFYRNKDITYRVIRSLEEFDCSIEPFTEFYENDFGIFERPTYEYVWITLAMMLAKRSTCSRNQVGAVITDPSMTRALCLGYNGDHAGGKNQCDTFEPGSCGCIHSEINALSKAKDDLAGCTLFVTTAPCLTCSKVLITRQIGRVVYLNVYRDMSGVKLLRENGIEVIKYVDLIRWKDDPFVRKFSTFENS